MTTALAAPSDQGALFVMRRTQEARVPPSRAATHAYSALLLYTHGRATMEQHSRFDLSPGDVLVVPAGERHRILSAKDAQFWGVGFHASAFAPSEASLLLEPFERVRSGATAVVRIPTSRQEHLGRLFEELHDEARDTARPATEQVSKSLLSLILAEVVRSGAWSTPGSPSLVGEALGFIERHCLGPLSLGEVAAAVHRSPAHVTTMLKRATGRSAVEWIVAGRLAEARRRLLHSDERIDIIAERVGYADPTHFIRLFRREQGLTPAAWRRLHRAPARP